MKVNDVEIDGFTLISTVSLFVNPWVDEQETVTRFLSIVPVIVSKFVLKLW